MSLVDSSNGRSFRMREPALLDRTPINVLDITSASSARRSRRAVLAAFCIVIVLGLSALSVTLSMKPGEAPKRASISYTVHTPITIVDDSQFTSANGVTGGTGTASDPYIIEGWEIDANSGMFGVAVMIMSTTAHFVIRGVHAYGTDASCIEMYMASNGTVENCKVDNASTGIVSFGCSDINITGNNATLLDIVGIAAIGSTRVNISGDIVTNNNNVCIMLTEADNITVTDCVASDSNGFGIGIQTADNIIIRGNNASSNTFCGLFINDTRKATIEGNNITMNLRFGAYVGNASDVNVFHNRFIGNLEQAYLGLNTTEVWWDDGYPSGGNYWSDYAGIDADGDGIGDTPYTFQVSGEDRYPFVSESMQVIPEFGLILLPVFGLIALFAVVGMRRRLRLG